MQQIIIGNINDIKYILFKDTSLNEKVASFHLNNKEITKKLVLDNGYQSVNLCNTLLPFHVYKPEDYDYMFKSESYKYLFD